MPALITVFQVETNSTRGLATDALGLVGSEAQPAIPALIPDLTHPNERLRGSTAYTLTRLGPEAVLALIDIAAHGSPEARATAAKVLRQVVSSPESPILTVRKPATDNNSVARRRAMQALGDLQPATAPSVKTLMAGARRSGAGSAPGSHQSFGKHRRESDDGLSGFEPIGRGQGRIRAGGGKAGD